MSIPTPPFNPIFRDRKDAGRQLAQRIERPEILEGLVGQPNIIVLALPRGGVPVGYEVAKKLKTPLEAFVVRKLGVPGQEELAMGAIASGGVLVLNEEIIEQLNIRPVQIDEVVKKEEMELKRREKAFNSRISSKRIEDQVVILVDDGLATGATMKAAIRSVRQMHPRKVMVAVPVAAPSTCRELATMVDEMLCLETPQPFYGVGMWYEHFPQTSDEEVQHILNNLKVVKEKSSTRERE